MSIAPITQSDPLAGLHKICAGDAIETDETERRFASQDVFFEGVLPLAIVSPATPEEVGKLVAWCSENGIAIYPRGGGMSYTEAFQPQSGQSIIIDFSRLAAIRQINSEDGHVVVEAGCTWAKLDQALAKEGMRARFWGPMSGKIASIGGGLSQGSVTFGSGEAGASANAVKSFEIVLGTGAILHTGSDGSTGTSAFNRNFGPDLTGIFANDAGALGIKTAATLEIEPRPELVDGLSFAFDDYDPMIDMMQKVRMRRLASEFLAMDVEVAKQNAGPPDLKRDMAAMWRIGRASGSVASAVTRMARVAMAGRSFLDKAVFTAHFMVEARDRDELRSRLKAIRGFARGGREIVNTVPLATRSAPFPDVPVTHPDGRRLLPLHGVMPESTVKAFHRAYLAFKQEHREEMERHGVTVSEFLAGIAGAGILYEPVFYWSDSRMLYHERRNPAFVKDMLKDYPDNPEGRQLVRRLVGEVVDLMRAHGSTHFQLGRLYPYASTREGEAGQLLRDLKQRFDPANILNPGALGL